ncbi:MAG: rhodanese-like domain-containing protein, partial [Burkholderiaceae bacterium]
MKRTTILATALAALGVGAAFGQAPAPAARPTIPQVCLSCHKAQAGAVQGIFENVAFKSQAIQLKIDAHMEIVRFDPKTIEVVDGGVVKTGEALREIAKNREARIAYVDKDGAKLATQISFKGPIRIAPEKLSNYAEVERLVALGPEKGNYTLIDSRPLPRVQEGTIPTSTNLPYPAWDKFVDRLPKDKSRAIIFFCQGVTCMMSPNSLLKAEALGYTNVKVYREGYPEWLEKNIGVIAVPSLKEAWIDKQIPHVLVDARPASTAAEGAIPGAVSIPPSRIRAAVAGFPDPKMKAPIIVYDGEGGNAALQIARVIKESGQPNVTVIGGGLEAWKNAKNAVSTGALPTQVVYVPKPRAGSIPNDEFVKLATATPAGVLILDVRNSDEA